MTRSRRRPRRPDPDYRLDLDRPPDPEAPGRALSFANQALEQGDVAAAERWTKLANGLALASRRLLDVDGRAFEWHADMLADEADEARRIEAFLARGGSLPPRVPR